MADNVNLADKLRTVRRFTGDKFSAARGYDARKRMHPNRIRTIESYFELIGELTSTPHMVMVPPRGGKKETFLATGQKGFPRFTKAIIHVPDPSAKYDVYIDKSRPAGSRFVMENRRTHERIWRIPSEFFLYQDRQLYDQDNDIPPEFFNHIIRDYGQGEVYVIEAGEYHMWGSTGTPYPESGREWDSIGGKLSDLFKSYGAGNFDEFDRNSSWIGNWFRGVQVYSDAQDFAPYFENRVRARAEYLARAPRENPRMKIRILKSGDVAEFESGRITRVHSYTSLKRLQGRGKRKRR